MENFYISTAISYTNGPPHMGHAYEVIAADVIARFNRLTGKIMNNFNNFKRRRKRL